MRGTEGQSSRRRAPASRRRARRRRAGRRGRSRRGTSRASRCPTAAQRTPEAVLHHQLRLSLAIRCAASRDVKEAAEKDFGFVGKVRGRPDAEAMLTPLFELWAHVLERIQQPDSGLWTSYVAAWRAEYPEGTASLKVALLRGLARILQARSWWWSRQQSSRPRHNRYLLEPNDYR